MNNKCEKYKNSSSDKKVNHYDYDISKFLNKTPPLDLNNFGDVILDFLYPYVPLCFIDIKIAARNTTLYRNSNLIKHILRRTLPQDNPVQPLKALHQYSCIQDVLECWEKRHHLSGPKKVLSMIFKMAARQILNNAIYCQVLYWNQAFSRKFSKYIFFCICFCLFLYVFLQ